MNIKALKEDLKKRQTTIVEELNQVIAQEQALAQQKEQLVQEALRLNGEARMLNRLNGDNKGK